MIDNTSDESGRSSLNEVSLTVPAGEAESVLGELLVRFPGGLEERMGPEPGTVTYVLYSTEPIRVPDLPGVRVRRRRVPGVDWTEQARQHFHPLELGDLRIIAPWMDRRDSRDLVIEPGMAFGTGGHESTRLALGALVATVEEMHPDSLLDVGCGTAILSLAGLRLGVERARACDVDPAAVAAARNNAEANGLMDRLNVDVGDFMEAEYPTFPVVVANLNAPLITAGAEALNRFTATGGMLILSGIYREQMERIRDVFGDRWREIAHTSEGDWVCLRLRREEDLRAP